MCTKDAISAFGRGRLVNYRRGGASMGSVEWEWPNDRIFMDNLQLLRAAFECFGEYVEKQKRAEFTTPRRFGPWRAKNHKKNNEFRSYLVNALKTQLGHVITKPPHGYPMHQQYQAPPNFTLLSEILYATNLFFSARLPKSQPHNATIYRLDVSSFR